MQNTQTLFLPQLLDGVGESQMKAVVWSTIKVDKLLTCLILQIDNEYTQIEKTLKEKIPDIEIIYIVVQKKISTRFFSEGNGLLPMVL